MMPKISVICSIYNNEEYISKSIDSVLSQTLKDIEIVCVYRKSTDNTSKILQAYAEKDFRIKLYEQIESVGCGPAKNLGIEKANGEYITFLDADDFYVDDKCLEVLYSTAKKENVLICGGLRSILDMQGAWFHHDLHRKSLENFPEGKLFYYQDLQFDYHFHQYIYSRNLLSCGNIRFGNQLTYDDIIFHAKAMNAAERFFIIPVEVYCYRLHGPYVWNLKQTIDSVKGFIDVLNFSKENNLELLHWKTVRRMTAGEYYENFIRHLNEGSMELYAALIKAQSYISTDLLKKAQNKSNFGEYFDGCDLPTIEKLVIPECTDYILSPLTRTMENFIKFSNELDEKKSYLENIKKSYSYRIGRIITFLPRKVLTFLRKR